MTPQHTHEPELHCPACIDQLTRFQTGLLPQSDTEVVREHLNSCPDCRLFADQVETVADLVGYTIDQGPVYSTNNAEYIQRLNAGSSTQAIETSFGTW